MRIAISGKMTSGKSTIRKFLEKEYGYVGHALADPIKQLERIHSSVHPSSWKAEVAIVVNQLVPANVENYLRKRGALQDWIVAKFNLHERLPGEKNRALLQDIGNGARESNPSIWIDALINRIGSNELVVVDDVRYLNEVAILRQANFKIWRVEIDSNAQRQRLESLYGGFDPNNLNHASEIELDYLWEEFDLVIDGSTDLKEFYESVDFILSGHCLKRGGIYGEAKSK